MISAEEQARRLAAWRKYPSDAAAAKALGLRSKQTYSSWRRNSGLPPRTGVRRLAAPEAKLRMDALRKAEGNADRAAKALGLSSSSFLRWLKRAGVRKTIRHPRPKAGHRLDRALGIGNRFAERQNLIEKGWTDVMVAQHQGISPLSVKVWRLANMPAYRRTRRLSEDEDRRRRAVYADAPNDRVAAKRLRMSVAGFVVWRRSRMLPAKRSRVKDA